MILFLLKIHEQYEQIYAFKDPPNLQIFWSGAIFQGTFMMPKNEMQKKNFFPRKVSYCLKQIALFLVEYHSWA